MQNLKTHPNIMWGRANIAIVIFLLGWLCIFTRAEGMFFRLYTRFSGVTTKGAEEAAAPGPSR